MIDPILIVAFVIVLFIITIIFTKKKDKQGRILDKYVTRQKVIEKLENFEPKLINNLKFGYTQTSIINQLKPYLMELFQNVFLGGRDELEKVVRVGSGDKEVGIIIKSYYNLQKPNKLNELYGKVDTCQRVLKSNLITLIIVDSDDDDFKKKITNKLNNLKAKVIFKNINAFTEV